MKYTMTLLSNSKARLLTAALVTIFALTSLNTSASTESTNASGKKSPTRVIESVTFSTDLGDVTFKLYPERAPKTVENFLAYAKAGFYNGTIFHRVIPGFVAQGGGLTFDFVKKATRDPVENESIGGLRNKRSTVAMARLPDPDSATAQFYVNLGNNSQLNADSEDEKPGYTVFAKVSKGMSVINQITRQPRGLYRAYRDAPNEPIRILSTQLNARD